MRYPKVFFLHNPKAAGTSIYDLLKEEFTPTQIAPNFENDAEQYWENNEDYRTFKGYSLYVGHYGANIFRAVSDGHVAITNFRRPAARIVSLYNFFRYYVSLPNDQMKLPRHAAVKAAQTLSFSEFISCGSEAIEIYIYNYHFRQLVGTGWRLTSTETATDACNFIDQMPWYYITEYPELSSKWGRDAFDWKFNEIPIKYENKSQYENHVRADNLTTADYKILSEKTQLDTVIYEYALQRMRSFAL